MKCNFPPFHDVVVKPFKVTYDNRQHREVLLRCEYKDFPTLAQSVLDYWQKTDQQSSGIGVLCAPVEALTGYSFCYAEILVDHEDSDTWIELRLKSKSWAEPKLEDFT